jgi:hypothetical protein
LAAATNKDRSPLPIIATCNSYFHTDRGNLKLLSGSGLVGIYVQLAMETPAHVKQGHAVHMEVVSAAWASGDSRHEGGCKENDNPDTDADPH